MELSNVFQLSPSESSASVIVLAHNQLPYTMQCLDSMRRHTRSPYEVIVVDNGSTDGTQEYLLHRQQEWRAMRHSETLESRFCRDFKIVQHAENLGYAAGNNAGLVVAECPHVVLMNNDVVVTRGWLERMMECAQHDPTIGITGPMTNYASGPQVIQQVAYDAATLEGLDQFAELWFGTHRVECVKFWRVVGFCMLIDRRVIDAIGGLDIRYGLGNFDDDDYCIRATIAGFQSVIARGAYVHHYGSRTFTEEGIDYQRQLVVNWELFKSKWGLPADLPYGAAYDLEWVLRQPLDLARHYVELAQQAEAA